MSRVITQMTETHDEEKGTTTVTSVAYDSETDSYTSGSRTYEDTWEAYDRDTAIAESQEEALNK